MLKTRTSTAAVNWLMSTMFAYTLSPIIPEPLLAIIHFEFTKGLITAVPIKSGFWLLNYSLAKVVWITRCFEGRVLALPDRKSL